MGPTSEDQERFTRWQAITIAQLTLATNMIFTLSVALLGFEVALMLKSDFALPGLQKWGFLLSLFATAGSIAAGIWLVINRLRDFRATKDAARLRLDGNHEEANRRSTYANDLGAHTWRLFWWQIGSFACGILFFGLSVVLPAASRSFTGTC
ncbi:MAG TPA: hypothetical protein VGG11_22850 [Xanthobacteraceae bacterium]